MQHMMQHLVQQVKSLALRWRVRPPLPPLKLQPFPADGLGMTARLIALQYPGNCATCRQPVAAGTEAWWDGTAKTVTCLDCITPADPFAPVDLGLKGTPGGSAAKEAERQARAGRGRRTVDAWNKGAHGERRLSNFLRQAADRGDYKLLDDRLIPGTKANIDHIAVAGTGIYIIDAKNYRGKVVREATGIAKWRTEKLLVAGRDRTHLADNMAFQVGAVQQALEEHHAGDIPVRPVLCFVASDWELFFTSFSVNGVRVMTPQTLRRLLRKPGPITISQRAELDRLLAMSLPPAVPQPELKARQA